MNYQKKLSTEEILKEIENGNTIDTNAIDFVEPKAQLNQLSRAILDKFKSFSKFATACYISSSHLNEFLNGKKKFGRDKLIAICITLKYTIPEPSQMLHRLGSTDLYSKNRRDFEILRCIKKGMTLDETNEHLLRNGLNDLYDKRKNP